MSAANSSQAIREKLDHPVIDSDGHFLEFVPVLNQYLREHGVAGGMAESIRAGGIGSRNWDLLTPEQRVSRRSTIKPWGLTPVENAIDLCTALVPKLTHQRLPELGIDFALLYPSAGLTFLTIEDDDIRRASCRALNHYASELYADYSDRLCPVATIPMHTPEEAIGELEHCVNNLGFKAAMIAGWTERRVEAVQSIPEAADYATWNDFYGLDSVHDYDPFWAKAVELGVPLSIHSMGMGWGSRRSISNYVYNHIGHFAAAMEASAKSLFLGGVTRRFPNLRIAFLEGGVQWAVSLFADLIGHWDKRNIEAVQAYNPERLDRDALLHLIGTHGMDLLAQTDPTRLQEDFEAVRDVISGDHDPIDDFARVGIKHPEDIRDLFIPNFYFGCEADDPMTSTAFNTDVNPFGSQLNAIFSSDIGHWDVPDMTKVLEEAYEGVERGYLSDAAFRDFVFANVARFYTDANPDFFEGTVVKSAVDELIASGGEHAVEATRPALA